MMKIHVRRPETKQFWALWIALLSMLSVANGAEVVLTSDPPGAVISVAGKEAGITPITLSLPAGQPVEVSSRFGPLGVLAHTLTPDENQVTAYQFKHEYGTLVVTCDRTDAALVIDGTGYGHPPAVVLVSPGPHKLFVAASNAPDKTRQVEVTAGQRASVEMDFSGGSPQTTKTSESGQAAPEASPSPVAKPTPSPNGRGSKPPATERTRVAWEEPPPLIPAAAKAAEPEPSSTPLPEPKHREKVSTHVALVSESGRIEKKKKASSPSAAARPDESKALSMFNERRLAKEEELKLEKEQIENGIKNSKGAGRERWKYRMAILQEKVKTEKTQEAALK